MSNKMNLETPASIMDVLKAGKIFIEIENVYAETPIGHVITMLNQNAFGLVAVLAPDDRVIGVVTDGDIRRLVLKRQGMLQHSLSSPVSEIMAKNPVICQFDQKFEDILDFDPSFAKLAMPVVNDRRKYIGVLDILRLLRFIHQ